MTGNPDAFKMIDQLLDRWCDRHALKPLRQLLPAYPPPSAHSDGLFDLYRALKDVKVFCKDELLPEEHEMLRTIMNVIADALDQQTGTSSWHV